MTPVNVAALVPWRRLLDHLGVEEPQPNAVAARCPTCRRPTLTTYQDTVLGGYWHYCHHCQKGADSLKLASTALGGDISSTVSTLVSWGLLPADKVTAATVTAYEDWYLRRQNQTEEFWKKAVSDLPTNGIGTIGVREILGLTQLDPVTWPSRGGAMLGSAPMELINDYIAPARWVFGAGGCASGIRGVRRKEPRDAVLLPFADMPGRFSAFMYMFANRGGEIKTYYRSCFSVLKTGGVTASYKTVPGITPLEAVFVPPGSLGSTLFVVNDPILAIKLQTRYKALQTGWLPVVAVWPEAPPCELLKQQGAHRDIVMWMARPDADGFRHAKAYNARVFWPPTEDRDELHVLRRFATSADWLAAQASRAVPWQQGLYRLAETKPPHEVDAILQQMGASPVELQELYDKAPGKIKTCLKATRAATQQGHKVVVSGWTVVEDGRGWTQEDGSVVIDAALHIDEVLVRPGTDKSWYRGNILFKGKKYPYTVERDELEHHPFKYMRTVLLKAGAGIPRYMERWRSKAVEIALGMREPKVVNVPTPGWDADADRFVFNNFAIRLGGEVEDLALPEEDVPRPALRLQKPAHLGASDFRVLDKPEVAAVVWPVVCCVAYNLLAPAFGRPPRGLLVLERSNVVREVAAACGCIVSELTGTNRASRSHKVSPLENPRGWPIALGYSQADKLVYDDRTSTTERNVLLETDELSGRVLFSGGGWFMMRSPDTKLVSDEVLRVVQQLIPDFLHFLLKKRLGGALNCDMAVRLKDELGWYVAERGGEADLSSVRNLQWTADAKADALVDILLTLMRRNKLQEGTNKKRDLVLSPTLVQVPVGWLNEVLESEDEFRLNLDSLRVALDTAGVLEHEYSEGGETYWLLNRRRFDKRRKTIPAPTALRVVRAGD